MATQTLQEALGDWAQFIAPIIAMQLQVDVQKVRPILQDHAKRIGAHLDQMQSRDNPQGK